MDGRDPPASDSPDNVGVEDVVDQLAELEETMRTSEQRAELRQTRRMLEQLPGGEQISKFTSRDMGEAFVGSIIFALPLLVEDGVFVIADHFLDVLVAGIPVALVANAVFVVGLTAGLIYGVDVREVRITDPILGVLPRRLVGVLLVSFLTSAALMFLWGRLFLDDPTQFEAVARVTVVWAAAALGASLGDILPGESKGYDLRIENIDEIVDFDDGYTGRRND
jgi:uncharacterized membrane protein